MALSLDPPCVIGSMACVVDVSMVETQLGLSGQGENRPPSTPELTLADAQPKSAPTATIKAIILVLFIVPIYEEKIPPERRRAWFGLNLIQKDKGWPRSSHLDSRPQINYR
jgi:hypothetical protein